MPVLPEVGSRIVWPGAIAPFSSASSIIERATRSLTEPVGLWDSSFAQMRTPGFGREALELDQRRVADRLRRCRRSAPAGSRPLFVEVSAGPAGPSLHEVVAERRCAGGPPTRHPPTRSAPDERSALGRVGAHAEPVRESRPPAIAGRITSVSPLADGVVEAVEHAHVLVVEVDVDVAVELAVGARRAASLRLGVRVGERRAAPRRRWRRRPRPRCSPPTDGRSTGGILIVAMAGRRRRLARAAQNAS